MADLVLKEEGFGDLLPGADAIVIDEAHQLPDVAAQFLGYSVSTRQLANTSKDVAGELLLAQQMTGNVDGALTAFDAQIAAVLSAAAGQETRLEHALWPEHLLEALNGLGARAGELAAAIAPLGGAEGQAAFTRLRERLEECAQRLRELTADEAPGGVRWAETTARSVSAHYAPVDVAKQLSALLEAQPCAWVFTSATLAVGEDFTHFKRRSGLARAGTVRFESPFDFPQQALMYLPKGLGDPGAPGHSHAVIQAALPVIESSGGRTFILFTSHRGLREGAEELFRHWGPRPPFPVLIQGGASRDQLLREFREAGNAVLLGTGSFWEGIDVKGEALSCRGDHRQAAVRGARRSAAGRRVWTIREQGGNPFFDEQVPQAVIALKQGVGRLIRDETDFGVVVLCDTRVVTKGYGRAFITSLPPMRRTRSLEEVQAFLRERLGTS
jgi:ATP-dependent DNA helicase DinG